MVDDRPDRREAPAPPRRVPAVVMCCPQCGTPHLPDAARCRECRWPLREGVGFEHGSSWLLRPTIRIGSIMAFTAIVAVWLMLYRLSPRAGLIAAGVLLPPSIFAYFQAHRARRRGREVTRDLLFTAFVKGICVTLFGPLALAFVGLWCVILYQLVRAILDLPR